MNASDLPGSEERQDNGAALPVPPEIAARQFVDRLKGYQFEALHTYTDRDGMPLFWRIRARASSGEKWIRPLRLCGTRYELKEPDFPGWKRPLYRLHELVANERAPVWYVEGELCADTLAELGLLATTAGGARDDERTEYLSLAGRHVLIWPDSDMPGIEHAARVNAKLRAFGCNVEVLDSRPLELPEGGDCVDWLKGNPAATFSDLETLPRLSDGELAQLNMRTLGLSEGVTPMSSQPLSGWPAPILFDVSNTPEIDATLLPDPVGRYVGALATYTETPPALGIVVALAVLSTAARGRVFVKLNGGHREPANLYGVAVLPSGSRKSSVFSCLSEPLTTWERDQAETLKPEIGRMRSRRKSEEALLEQRRRRLHSIDDVAAREREMEAITEAEACLTVVSPLPKLFANDATPESLAAALDEQDGVFSVLSDEGGIFDVLSGLYTNGVANVDVVLKGWDRGACRIRRKDRAIDMNPCLTLGLAVQPSTLRNFAGKRAFQGRGMAERILFAMPRSTLGFREHDKPAPDLKTAEAYRDAIRMILSDPTVRTPTLSEAAESEFREFQHRIEVMLRPGGKLAEFAGWGSKLTGQLARVAGLMHLVEQPEADQIAAGTMTRALDLGALLIDHALAAFGEMGLDQATLDARRCWGWIEGRTTFTRGELTFAMRHTLNAERITDALPVLAGQHLIDPPQGTPTPRSRELTFQTNPETWRHHGMA